MWMARIVVNGKQIASRMFPPGKKGGPEWRAAKEWEEKELFVSEDHGTFFVVNDSCATF